MSEPLYYPKDGAVFRRPVTTGTGTSMGFKVCDVNPGVEPAEVAKLLSLGERYGKLQKALDQISKMKIDISFMSDQLVWAKGLACEALDG